MRRTICLGLILATAGTPGCEDLPRGAASVRPGALRAISLVDWSPTGYAAPASELALDEIVDLGANAVVLTPTGYQDDGFAALPATDSGRTPTMVAVAQAIQWATERELRVVLKPHIDLDSGEWRGTLRPADPDAWFEAYSDFLLRWADLAEAESVQIFVVGTELAGTLEHEARWRELIATVRERFSGRLTYAASWDEADLVPFWDTLDVAGIDQYGPLRGSRDVGRFELLQNWQPWLLRMRQLHDKTQLNILLTEIGYRSVDGAGQHPFEFGLDGPEDEAEQADLYWAAMEATAAHAWIDGLVWWNWLAQGGSGVGDFTPRAKLAETELREAWNP